VSRLELRPVGPALLRTQVAASLRDAIGSLTLAPGDRLIEHEIVISTGASRGTVREALRELAAEGLVSPTAHRGVVVAAPTAEQAREAFEVRAAIEAIVADHAARHATVTEVRDLREAYQDYAAAQRSSHDIRAWLLGRTGFYRALFAAAHNPTASALDASLQARTTALRAAVLATPGRGRRSLRETKAVLDAITAREPEQAAQASRVHVEAVAAIACADSASSTY
jgi:GntR family transcriptional regulator, trigonelline degradation regulator